MAHKGKLPSEPEPYSARLQQDVIALVSTLRDLLPLAEAYLKGAPSDPANAILEDARWLLIEHGRRTGKSSTSVPAARGKALHFTKLERAVLRGAAASRLAGEIEDEDGVTALQSALEKLQC